MSGIDLTEVMQRLYASEINCAVQSQWDAGFVVSIGGDTRYGSSDASETFAADELAEAAAWLAGKHRQLYPESGYAGRPNHAQALATRMGQILVGTSSWTDKTLIESGKFYPPSAKTPEDRLRYYASQFPIVEIDSSYYGLPTEENTVRWVERTPPGFVFNIKTYRLFTLHQTPVISLPKHLREALGPSHDKNVYDKDVPEEIKHELWADFRRVLAILRDAGKLGAVHMQFAPWVAFHPENFEHLEFCRAMLAGFAVAIEFRNKTWFDTEKHTARTLEFERENGFVNVVVDAPQNIANTIPSVWQVTNPALAIVRLHGRNHGTWNTKGLKASSSRFDYDYREEELEEMAAEIKQLAPNAQRVHVLFNNNYQDQGQRGAAALTSLLNSP